MIKVSVNELKITLGQEAIKQIKLIILNDFKLENQVFRLQISGKGCHGFDYSIGFTDPLDDDLILTKDGVQLSIDPFTAFYSKEGVIDYLCIEDTNEEGFIFTNKNQNNYRGKFFKNETTLPTKILS